MKKPYQKQAVIIAAVLITAFTSGCATTTQDHNVAIKTDVRKHQGKPKTSQVGKEKFNYLSKIITNADACPERDSKSYGLLMQSKTIRNGNELTCYYN